MRQVRFHVRVACRGQPYEDLESERVPGELLGLGLTGNAVLRAPYGDIHCKNVRKSNGILTAPCLRDGSRAI